MLGTNIVKTETNATANKDSYESYKWEIEFCETKPEPVTYDPEKDTYILRKDIHSVKYTSMDGYDSVSGYECFYKEIPHRVLFDE